MTSLNVAFDDAVDDDDTVDFLFLRRPRVEHWTAEVIAHGRANIEKELALFVALSDDLKLARTSALTCLFVFWNNRIDGHGTANLAATISIVKSIFESGLPIENDPSWSKERRECVNQIRAWQHLESNSFSFTRESICHVHSLLVAGDVDVSGGELRTVAVCTADGSKIYPSPDQVPRLVDEWLLNVNKLLSSTGVCRYQAAAYAMTNFAEIHPFDDGNGRLSRLIANAVLQRLGFPILMVPKEGKYLKAIKNDQQKNLSSCPCTTAWILASCLASLRVLSCAEPVDLDADR